MEKDDQYIWQQVASELHGMPDHLEKAFSADPERKDVEPKLLQRAGQIYHAMEVIKPMVKIDDDASWRSICRQIRLNALKKYGLVTLKYAAIVVITLIAGYFIYPLNNGAVSPHHAWMDVPFGQTGHLTLSDGTEVWLNSGSQLSYPGRWSQKERAVYLDGEGFFKVVPDKNRPFKVKTAGMEIEVLGTSFNVFAYGEESRQSVVLEEGKIRINDTNGIKLVDLTPGQIAERDGTSARLQVRHVAAKNFTGWKDGVMVFEAETLDEIANRLERWYNVEVRFEKAELRKFRITGTILRDKPVYQITQAIELLAPVTVEYQPQANEKDLIIIKK